jgi:hypothetical protein
MPNHPPEQPETSVSNPQRPARTRIVVVAAVLLATVFLAGFLPMYMKGQRLTSELREARQESSMAELRDLAGLLFLQASQMDYGLAASTSTRFFERTREVASQVSDSSRRKPLEDLLPLRDQVTAALAKGEPNVLNDLQALFVETRQATMVDSATLRTDRRTSE